MTTGPSESGEGGRAGDVGESAASVDETSVSTRGLAPMAAADKGLAAFGRLQKFHPLSAGARALARPPDPGIPLCSAKNAPFISFSLFRFFFFLVSNSSSLPAVPLGRRRVSLLPRNFATANKKKKNLLQLLPLYLSRQII